MKLYNNYRWWLSWRVLKFLFLGLGKKFYYICLFRLFIYGGVWESVSFLDVNKLDLYLIDVCISIIGFRDYLGNNCWLFIFK